MYTVVENEQVVCYTLDKLYKSFSEKNSGKKKEY